MGKPRDDWWPSARSAIRAYPGRRQRLDELRRTSLIPRYGPGPVGGGQADPVQAAVLRQLPPRQQEELEAVEWAIAQTRALPDGANRLRLLELYHFKRSHNLCGAGLAVGYAEPTARRINGDFVRLVGHRLGYR